MVKQLNLDRYISAKTRRFLHKTTVYSCHRKRLLGSEYHRNFVAIGLPSDPAEGAYTTPPGPLAKFLGGEGTAGTRGKGERYEGKERTLAPSLLLQNPRSATFRSTGFRFVRSDTAE